MTSKTHTSWMLLGIAVAGLLSWSLWPFQDRPSPNAAAGRTDPPPAQEADPALGADSISQRGPQRRARTGQAPGTATVEYQDGLLTVIALGIERELLMRRVAQVVGLQLIVSSPISGTLDANIESIPFELALQQLLSGVDYAVEHRFDAQLARHVPISLRLGTLPANAPTAASDDPARYAPPGASPPPAPVSTSTSAVAKARAHAQHDEYRTLLQGRTSVLAQMQQSARGTSSAGPSLTEPEAGPGLPSKDGLLQLLASDEVAQVRAAAAFQLGAESGSDVTGALLGALSDRNPAVALQAIDSLIQIGDSRVIPELQARQAGTSQPNVKDALARAIVDLDPRTGSVAQQARRAPILTVE